MSELKMISDADFRESKYHWIKGGGVYVCQDNDTTLLSALAILDGIDGIVPQFVEGRFSDATKGKMHYKITFYATDKGKVILHYLYNISSTVGIHSSKLGRFKIHVITTTATSEALRERVESYDFRRALATNNWE